VELVVLFLKNLMVVKMMMMALRRVLLARRVQLLGLLLVYLLS